MLKYFWLMWEKVAPHSDFGINAMEIPIKPPPETSHLSILHSWQKSLLLMLLTSLYRLFSRLFTSAHPFSILSFGSDIPLLLGLTMFNLLG